MCKNEVFEMLQDKCIVAVFVAVPFKDIPVCFASSHIDKSFLLQIESV